MYGRSFARLSVLSRFVDARDDLNFKDHHVYIMLPKCILHSVRTGPRHAN